MLKKYLFVFPFLLFNLYSLHGQTGFFGKKNAIEFHFNAAPTLKFKNALNGSGTAAQVLPRRRVFNSSYSLKYNRVMTNRIALNLSFDLASMHSYKSSFQYAEMDQPFGISTTITERVIEPTVSYSGISVGIDFFGYGAINPVGFRWGVSLDYGLMLSDYSQILVYETETYTTSIGVSTSETNIKIKNYNELNSQKINVFAIRWKLGKNIILTRSLLLKLDASFNLFSQFLGGGSSSVGIIDSFFNGLSSFQSESYNLLNNSFEEEELENYKLTYYGYRRFNLSVGMSYFF